jgi:ethanolamine utilization protein EutQ (cupin superfamily)
MAGVKLFSAGNVEQKFNDRGTSWHEFINEKDNSKFGSGITYFQDSDFEWTLWYDEMLICIDPGKLLEIVVDGHAYPLEKGDSIWIPEGTVARYRAVGHALIYYAISPANWRTLNTDYVSKNEAAQPS